MNQLIEAIDALTFTEIYNFAVRMNYGLRLQQINIYRNDPLFEEKMDYINMNKAMVNDIEKDLVMRYREHTQKRSITTSRICQEKQQHDKMIMKFQNLENLIEDEKKSHEAQSSTNSNSSITSLQIDISTNSDTINGIPLQLTKTVVNKDYKVRRNNGTYVHVPKILHRKKFGQNISNCCGMSFDQLMALQNGEENFDIMGKIYMAIRLYNLTQEDIYTCAKEC
jgi:hypothetical protein